MTLRKLIKNQNYVILMDTYYRGCLLINMDITEPLSSKHEKLLLYIVLLNSLSLLVIPPENIRKPNVSKRY